jgi:hypothetical protein
MARFEAAATALSCPFEDSGTPGQDQAGERGLDSKSGATAAACVPELVRFGGEGWAVDAKSRAS